MKADLHMHSTWSDGRYTMKQLVDEAKRQEIDLIAITDHDVVGNVDEAIAYGTSQGVVVLPGIELSTLEQNKSVHLLGYFTDNSYKSDEMKQYFVDIRQRRETRARQMIQNLKHYYDIEITYQSVQSFANGIIARPHIAKAITEAYPKYDHDYIFDHFIGDHCDAYIPSVELPVAEGLDLLRRNGCIVVLAHPTLLKEHIKHKVMGYPFDGIEAYYIRNKPGEESRFFNFATKRDMMVTGGSDFHGIEGDTKHGWLGDVFLTGESLHEFLHRIKKSHLYTIDDTNL